MGAPYVSGERAESLLLLARSSWGSLQLMRSQSLLPNEAGSSSLLPPWFRHFSLWQLPVPSVAASHLQHGPGGVGG